MLNVELLGLAAVLALVLQLAAHWAPGRRNWHPVVCYVYGTASILLGFSIWAGFGVGCWDVVLGAWIVAVATGTGTVTGYVVDWLTNAAIRRRLRREIEEVADVK